MIFSAAVRGEGSFRARVFPPAGVRHLVACFCWCCAAQFLVRVRWVRDGQVQEEEEEICLKECQRGQVRAAIWGDFFSCRNLF